MDIYGLQKMTLLDYPGHVACTVFTGGCDFRCPFCHNFELAERTCEPIMNETELLKFLDKRRGLLDGVAFTGGEPLMDKGLPELIRTIRSKGFLIKLDTNGYHPDALNSLINEKLVDYIAMDIKNSPQKYPLTCGVKKINLDTIQRSIKIIMDSGCEYEFRTTVIHEFHKTDDFIKIGEMIKGADKFFIQPFTDRDTVPTKELSAPLKEEIQQFVEIMKQYVKTTEVRSME